MGRGSFDSSLFTGQEGMQVEVSSVVHNIIMFQF
jgi:hypothetical protein